MILQVGVKVLLKNKTGKYLILHRSLVKYPDIKGMWDIVGGRINPGYTLIDNLKREIKEETNLNLTSEPVLVAAQDILRRNGRHVVRLTYSGEAKGDVKLDTNENDSYKWLYLEEIKKMEDLDIYFRNLLEEGFFD